MGIVYLMNWLKHFLGLQPKSLLISLSVAEGEKIVRGIVHPMSYSYSEGKLKDLAFLPPLGRCDVSMALLHGSLDACFDLIPAS